MRTAAGLAALTAGAILTFAVSARVPGINLRIAGVIIMIAAIVSMTVPSRLAAWLRDRGGAAGHFRDEAADEDDDAYAYLLQDPAVLAAEVLKTAREGQAGNVRPIGQRLPGSGTHDA